MARRMEAAWQAPVFHVSVEAELQAWERPERAKLTDLLLQRCAQALMAHPKLNAHYDPDALAVTYFDRADIGLAVATDRGLLVPVLPGVEALSLGEVAAERQAAVAKARAGRLTGAEMQGATFTVSNLGMYSVVQFDAIVNVPQVAILAVGAIQSRAVVVDGRLAEKQVLPMTLTCDHRVVDGATAAMFLQDLVGPSERTEEAAA
jgi:pyruvate dehydrogenase E2 component (dihydrolipoamide acetyltransferase)